MFVVKDRRSGVKLGKRAGTDIGALDVKAHKDGYLHCVNGFGISAIEEARPNGNSVACAKGKTSPKRRPNTAVPDNFRQWCNKEVRRGRARIFIRNARFRSLGGVHGLFGSLSMGGNSGKNYKKNNEETLALIVWLSCRGRRFHR